VVVVPFVLVVGARRSAEGRAGTGRFDLSRA
jgi:hypothetical protein